MENGELPSELPRKVYYVESSDDNTVLVGMDITLEKESFQGNDIVLVSWFDTVRDRMMKAADIKLEGDVFSFRRLEKDGGGVYYFTPMTLQIYNDKVKKRLLAGGEFTSEEEMEKAFFDTESSAI